MSAAPSTLHLDRLSDGELVLQAQSGDQYAFAELYDRYFDRVYDFLTRMMRNRSEAEDVTQDTFIRAMNSLERLDNPSSFKSWLFTIARNTALNRIEKAGRSRPMPVVGEDSDETLELYIVDTDRLGSPQDAVQAEEIASLVWEAASGLNPKQYSLLDLHIRQGLDSGDIAEVLNVSRNNAYVMLNRMKAALAETVTAYIMMNDARSSCPDLERTLERSSVRHFTPAARKIVMRHIDSCDRCQERQAELVSPVAILGALMPAPAAVGVKDTIRQNMLDQWPGAVAAPGASGQSGTQFNHQLLASIASIVVGAAILLAILLTSFGSTSPAAAESSTGTALILVFNGSGNEPLTGVEVQLFSRDDSTPVVRGTSGVDGSITWDDAEPGIYDLVIERLPDGIELPDEDRAWQVTIDAGERLVLTATLHTGGG